MTAPIALFVYNRPMHTRQTVEALQRNLLADKSDLFVYSDAPKSDTAANSVAEVRDYVRRINGFKSVTIIEREKNLGVDPSIIDGTTYLCQRFGTVIVVEDDIVTTSSFLSYMNDALDCYRDESQVMHISGFMYPVAGFASGESSFLSYTNPWGWATWQRAWTKFDPQALGYESLKGNWRLSHAFNQRGAYNHFGLLKRFIDGKTDAWDVRWYLSVFCQNGLALYPNNSLVDNIGFDGTGVHCEPSDYVGNSVIDSRIVRFPDLTVNRRLARAVERFLHKHQGHTLWYYFRYVLIRGMKKKLLRESE
jgi:hypothetical protein